MDYRAEGNKTGSAENKNKKYTPRECGRHAVVVSSRSRWLTQENREK